MKTIKIPVSKLKTDNEITSLRVVNPVVVSRYRQAAREGANFPPLVVTTDYTVVSGNHRLQMYLAEFGDKHEVECIVKSFKDRAELLEEAVRENAKHGNPLDGFSRRKFALRLVELGRDAKKVASIFGVSVKRIEEWGGVTVVVRGKGNVPTKRGLEHISGQTVKVAEYENHCKHDRGVPAVAQAKQLTAWINNGWIDTSCEKTMTALEELFIALQTIKA
jgi:hypothetical protein